MERIRRIAPATSPDAADRERLFIDNEEFLGSLQDLALLLGAQVIGS